MGILFSRLFRNWLGEKEFKVVIIGLNNAGKTTILYKLHLGEVVMTQPTIGSNVEEIKYKNLKFTAWDVGGQESLRSSWSVYYSDCKALLMIVDSTDKERLPTVKEELFKALGHEDLKKAALLVFANKQDLHGSMSAGQISEALDLASIKTHPWHIQACCALTGEGLKDGMEWLSKKVPK
uniref:Uncharacterized protein n=1 Tax=Palpitomonas bilix TaxID=652834 RepID=A0A7S3DLC5_9EUKA|mmetsp:Transcript_42020/g.108155  ORF Transcript_42020/g.108155 Transcript_42020/m.108155 type:complete len:180 (+) Transcript_42020:245-784(+)